MANKAVLLFGVIGLMATTSCLADKTAGRASVIDGDTIETCGQRIRLHGVDAPEAGQEAALALSDFLGARPVRCVANGISYDRLVAVCEVDRIDVASWLVREGWAIASVRHTRAYVDEERAAREIKRHIWQGTFVNPRDWRSRRRLQRTR